MTRQTSQPDPAPTHASPARQQRGLGRGLGALIPSAAEETGARSATTGAGAGAGAGAGPSIEPGGGTLSVPVGDIMPNPRQPRSVMSPEALNELAASIRQHGLIQPLIIMRARATDPVPYQLIAGERRWRAAQLAGLAAVPALLKEATPEQVLELALVENIQRADLNALEEAAAYQALINDFGLTQAQVAERVGRSRVAVANVVRLLRLPQRIRELLAGGSLTEGHARALLGLEDDELMLQAAGQVVTRDLTVRQTEELVRRLLAAAEDAAGDEAEQAAGAADEAAARQTQQLETAFRSALGTKVSLLRSRRGGKVVIHFYSDEELQTIYEHIVGS